jgi:penicillin amidase
MPGRRAIGQSGRCGPRMGATRGRVVAIVAALATTAALGAPAVAAPSHAVDIGSDVSLEYRDEQVRLVRTADFGIPHVYADDLGALFYGSGYATAQDRLWQAELFRRSGAGTLAEVLGPGALPADRAVRRDDYTDAEYAVMWEALPADIRTMISSYADGINAYIAEATAEPFAKMPVEFFSAGFPQRPEFPAEWTARDVLRSIVFFVRRFGETGGADIVNADLLQTFGPDVFADLRWSDDPDAYATNPNTGSARPGRAPGFSAAWNGPDVTSVADRIQAQNDRFTDTLIELGIPHKGGSNAWAVNSWRADGQATRLLGGPQMGYTIPQITHEIGLHGAGFDVQGMTFAGASPFPLIGRSKGASWTSTTGVGDTMDHVIELLAPCQDPPSSGDAGDVAEPLSYLHDGQCLQTDVRTEVIDVAGRPPVELHVHRTVHGPVVALDPGSNIAVAVERVHWMRELDAITAFAGFSRARNWHQFETAARDIWTNHNFVYNDARGTIGYTMVGRLPVRAEGVDSRLPRLGDGSQEWQGFTEIVPLTSGTNPVQGYFVNWNNKPVPDWDNGDAGAAFGPTHRVGVLADALAADDTVSWDDMNRINQVGGYTWIAAHFFRPMLLRAGEVAGSPSDDVAEALALVASWDGRRTDAAPDDGYYDDPGLTIFRAWHDAMLDELFGHVEYTTLGDPPPPEGAADVLWRLFVADDDHPGDPALPIHADWLQGRDVDQVAIDVLERVVDERLADGPLETWLTPEFVQNYSTLGALPSVSHPFLNRGTYNQIVEFTRSASRSVNVNPPGQSGLVTNPTSPTPADHTRDQLDLYASWRYKPQHLDPLRPVGGQR